MQGISPQILTLVRSALLFGPSQRKIPKLMIGEINILHYQCNNKHIRKVLTMDHSCPPIGVLKWRREFPQITYENIWSCYSAFLIPNKVKEVHAKILYGYYPCNKFLSKFIDTISPMCSFCGNDFFIVHLLRPSRQNVLS